LLVLITLVVGLVKGEPVRQLFLPGMILGALLLWQRYFDRLTLVGTYLISFVGILGILAYGILGALLLGTGFRPVVGDLATAFYFTVTTLSTVGYGDIVPETVETRMFVASLIVAGLSVFTTVVISTIGPSILGHLNHFFNLRGGVRALKNHVILVGEGQMAHNIARELNRRKTIFIQIVSSGSTPDPANDWPVIEGDANTDAMLQKAGIGNARMVIAALDDDGDNAFISLAAKALKPAVQVLAVASSAQAIQRLKLAQTDLVFAPVAVGARLLANLVEGDAIPSEFQDLLEG
jgi:voltage-gated potassium channel